MELRLKTTLVSLGLGTAALAALAVCLILGVGNHSFLAALSAAAIFLLAALCISPAQSGFISGIGLLFPLTAFSVIYVGSAGWNVEALGFFAAIDLCAVSATMAGLGLMRGMREQRLTTPIGGLIAAAAAVTVIAWFVPLYADRQLEQHQITEVSYPAPEIHLSDLDGKPVDLQQLRGKVVVMDFWASWCGPCLQEMPALDAMVKHYAGSAEVAIYAIASNQDETPEIIDGFVKSNHYVIDTAYDTDGKAAVAFHVLTFPTLVIIDANGTVRYSHNGFNTDSSPFQIISAKIETLRADALSPIISSACTPGPIEPSECYLPGRPW
ncbi:MAG TPA: TlpA disulfide reductase family protein [Gammaproteobacteria bacterium]|jgi:thiol-disulfide isomerase/thioredoxin|nr:TlpA disulfide reductase family protein [Gammaproteobacteria bacterium]